MLQCPHCNLALREHFEGEVEIDVCDGCSGVWLDHGELETLSNGKDFAPHVEASDGLPYLRCPRCETQGFQTIRREKGVVARCADCLGIFVAGEEVERVVAMRRSEGLGPDRKEWSKTALEGIIIVDVLGTLLGEFWQ